VAAPERPATPTAAPAPRPSLDGFVIREAQGAVPTAPVDALVVGAPAPVPDPVEAEAADSADASATAPPTSFRISSATTADVPAASELWTTRNPAKPAATEQPHPGAARRGWSMRHSEVVDRSAQATMLRLREEAVNVSWKSAWIAVTTSDPRLLRKRRQRPPVS
jgi:hypothetical protein